MIDKPMKFLGSEISDNNSPHAMSASIYSKLENKLNNMLGIKNPSQLYNEAYAGAYTMIRMKGDGVVNHALDSRLERESTWKKKSSSIVEADKVFKENLASNKISLPTTETEAEKHTLINKAKKKINKSIKEVTLAVWNQKVKKKLHCKVTLLISLLKNKVT